MITLEIVELANGLFGVRAIGQDAAYGDTGEFGTREEAEEWIFDRSEQLARGDDPHSLTPGTGQGPR
jgi:hypothetical protein